MPTYNITATAGAGGSISSLGITAVPSGGSQTYIITPNPFYYVASVLVDAVPVVPVTNTYTFSNVTALHTIAVTFAIPGMTQAIVTLLNTLQAGMTTGHSEVEDFYVLSWYLGDPIGLYQILTPAAAIIPAPPTSRVSQYVGEDAITETYVVRFYQPAYRNSTDPAEVTAGFTRLLAMREKALILLRTDPTFSSQYVASEIVSENPSVATAGDNNAFRITDISFQIKRRQLWGQ